MRLIAALLLCWCCFDLVTLKKSQAAELEVEVVGLRSEKGKVRLGVCKDMACYERGSGFFMNIAEKAQAVGVVFTLKDLEPGAYTLLLFHDEDEDNKFKKNFIGWPLEGFAFSNNVSPGLGKPDYEDVVFMVGETQTKQKITMLYW